MNDIQTELIYFFGAAVLFIIIVAIVFGIFCKKFKFDSANVKFYGLLLNLNTSSLISISAMTIQYLFIVWCTISFREMNIIYLAIILILVLISEAVVDNFKGLFVSGSLALINCGAIEIVYLISDHIWNEEFSLLLMIILFLLVLFIFLYDTYNYLRSINNVVVKNKYLKRKKYTL